MDFQRLGRSGLLVSRLCLGTMNFGPRATEELSHQIMDKALENGINFFDTANVYGGKKGEGLTEQIIGSWFDKGNLRREQIVLATKVYGSMGEGQNERRLSAFHIRKACEDSLRRLKTDHIDLYQMHHIDRNTTWDEIWQAMEILVRDGKVIYIGSSNFAGWHIAQAQSAANSRNFLGLVSEQSLYNLLERSIELEVIPACREYGLGIIPYSPLAGGLLGGILNEPLDGRRASESTQKQLAEQRDVISKFEDLCSHLGESPADVALAWLIHQPGITAPIIGPRTTDQLDGNIHAESIKLDSQFLNELEAIFPGPGGPAPEAYAW